MTLERSVVEAEVQRLTKIKERHELGAMVVLGMFSSTSMDNN